MDKVQSASDKDVVRTGMSGTHSNSKHKEKRYIFFSFTWDLHMVHLTVSL